MEKQEILSQLEELKAKYGEWSSDIPLTDEIWTRGNEGIPQTRLRRIVQLSADLAGKPLSECRVLDLGALDGSFAIEFARQGAQSVGIEIREANIRKAQFGKEVLGLSNLTFHQDDARNISREKYGSFDVIVCSGLLYHLTAADAIGLMKQMFDMSTRMVVLDTHIALEPRLVHEKNGAQYFGISFDEHDEKDSQEVKEARLWASWDNPKSFWFTRPSLVNALSATGFSSVYECFAPEHVNFGIPGMEQKDRCTFVAIKSSKVQMFTSPQATNYAQRLPEHSLDYGAPAETSSATPNLLQRVKNRLSRSSK